MKGEETGTGNDTGGEKDTTTSSMRKIPKESERVIEAQFLKKEKVSKHIPVMSTSTSMSVESFVTVGN